MVIPAEGKLSRTSVGSWGSTCSLSHPFEEVSWDTHDFIWAHNEIRASGMYNFEFCKISIPTSIRYDRLREALGVSINPKEKLTVSAPVWYAYQL